MNECRHNHLHRDYPRNPPRTSTDLATRAINPPSSLVDNNQLRGFSIRAQYGKTGYIFWILI